MSNGNIIDLLKQNWNNGIGQYFIVPDHCGKRLTARAAVIEALLNQSWRPTVRRNIVRPLPAVLIAHGLGIGEDEFLQRNNVRHPLFVNGEVYG